MGTLMTRIGLILQIFFYKNIKNQLKSAQSVSSAFPLQQGYWNTILNILVNTFNIYAIPASIYTNPVNINVLPLNINAHPVNINATPLNINTISENINTSPVKINAIPENMNDLSKTFKTKKEAHNVGIEYQNYAPPVL